MWNEKKNCLLKWLKLEKVYSDSDDSNRGPQLANEEPQHTLTMENIDSLNGCYIVVEFLVGKSTYHYVRCILGEENQMMAMIGSS